MRVSVSNIAWTEDMDAAVYAMLRTSGVGGLEVAPTRVWPEWKGITADSLRGLRQRVTEAGLEITSLQSILFQKPDLQLFGDQGGTAFGDHLRYCADLAADLGAKSVVLGAPKNRIRGTLTPKDAMESACTSLTPIAEHYAHTGIMLCLEPNPEQYGCDFVTRGADAAMLVRAVDSDGLRLHLDTACAALAGESAGHLARENRDILAHFHASEPMLAGFDNPGSQHAVAAAALREIGYKGWVAVEMRKQDDPLGSLQAAVSFATKTYGDGAN